MKEEKCKWCGERVGEDDPICFECGAVQGRDDIKEVTSARCPKCKRPVDWGVFAAGGTKKKRRPISTRSICFVGCSSLKCSRGIALGLSLPCALDAWYATYSQPDWKQRVTATQERRRRAKKSN